MATERKDSTLDEEVDEPSEEELERERHQIQDWKKDRGRELSDLDEERPLKP
ncbi:hypothetical protein [Pseudomonas sp. MYb118]|uniref:hypothetical protein n=1 Tax=Pseudomonas sp. MYb118 TaxID=1848720 RepID=UPI0034CDF645